MTLSCSISASRLFSGVSSRISLSSLTSVMAFSINLCYIFYKCTFNGVSQLVNNPGDIASVASLNTDLSFQDLAAKGCRDSCVLKFHGNHRRCIILVIGLCNTVSVTCSENKSCLPMVSPVVGQWSRCSQRSQVQLGGPCNKPLYHRRIQFSDHSTHVLLTQTFNVIISQVIHVWKIMT